MGVDLLKHNQEAFQEINKMIDSRIKKIVAPRIFLKTIVIRRKSYFQ